VPKKHYFIQGDHIWHLNEPSCCRPRFPSLKVRRISLGHTEKEQGLDAMLIKGLLWLHLKRSPR
jgi:hypothetical protein